MKKNIAIYASLLLLLFLTLGSGLHAQDIMKVGTNLNNKVLLPAATHMAKNVGTTSLKLIMTELKPVEKK